MFTDAIHALVAALALLLPLIGVGLVGAVLSADKWAQKMLDRIGNAGGAWEDGMRAASGTIVSRARGAEKKWEQNVQRAIADKSFGKGLARITDEDIINQAIAIGGGALVDGVRKREAKVQKAIAALQPKVQALQQKIAGMKNETDADAEARALEAIRGMRAIGRELAGLSK